MTTETAIQTKAPRSKGSTLPVKRTSRIGKIVGLFILIAGLGGAGFVGYTIYTQRNAAATSARGQGPQSRPASVLTAQAYRGDMTIYLNALGTVTAYNSVTIRTRIDGQLDKVNFTEGQKVTKGQTLFEIDPRPYRVQLAQAEAQLAKDQSALENAQRDLTRYKDAGNAVPQQLRDQTEALVSQAEAQLKNDKSQIDSVNLNITYCTILAPMDGTIGLRLVDQGNMVHAGDAGGLAVITQLQPITVYFNLPQDNLPAILKAREAGDVIAEAWDRDLKRMLTTGKMSALDNQIDPTTASVRIKAEFANEDLSLYPNQFVNVKLRVNTLRSVVMVDSAALQKSGDLTFVYLVKDAPPATMPVEPGGAAATNASQRAEQIVEQRTVEVGPSEGKYTVVTKGLDAGDVVVTDGVDKLVDGSKVIARSASTQPSSGRGAAESQPAAGSGSSGRGRRGATTAPATGG